MLRSTFSTLGRRPRLLILAVAAAALVAAGAAAVLAPAASAQTAARSVTGRIVAVPVPAAPRAAAQAAMPTATGSGTGAASAALGGVASAGRLGAYAASGLATYDVGQRFDLVGVLFRTLPGTRGRDVAVTARASLDGVRWTRWITLRADLSSGPLGSVQSGSDCVSEPAWVGAARYLQYRVVPATGVSSLRFACVASPVASAVTATPFAAPAAAAPAGATAGAAAPAGARLGMPARPDIVSRAQWGASESLRSGTPCYGEVRCALIHHTVNGNHYTRAQAPALVRGIYYYHTRVNGWSDIGYNFLIDRFGTIYEGRYGGMKRAVIGAQVLGFNSWSTGISVIGTYSTVRPSAAALDALERLLAWKLDVHHVDPLGTTKIQCSTSQKYRAGQWVAVSDILGHRDVNFTECPGNALYGLLPTIRRAVAAIGNPKVFAPSVSQVRFSPNGDGLKDTSSFAARLSEQATWAVQVNDAAGAEVRRFSGAGDAVAATWDGRNDAGQRVADGLYSVSIGATDAHGAARAVTLPVVVDTTPPAVSTLAVAPLVISPNGDRIADKARARLRVGEPAKVRLLVRDGAGATVRTAASWRAVAAGSHALVWDGRVSGGGGLVAAPDGEYTLVLQARDGAANQAAATAAVTVNDTLAGPRARPAWISPNGDGLDDATTLVFSSTRSARVTVEVRDEAAALVRRLPLGALPAGAHEVVWDGRAANGTTAPSGLYRCAITAVNAAGTVALPYAVHVDLLRPKPVWSSSSVSLRRGRTLRAGFSVADDFSRKALVRIVVRSSTGAVVAARSPIWVPTGVTQSWAYKPTSRGTYSLSLYATDRAGNRQARVGVETLIVK